MKRKIVGLFFVIISLCLFIPRISNANEYYDENDNISFTVNGAHLPIKGYEPGKPWDNCWTFANIIYEKIWGTSEESNLLRSVKNENDLKITAANTRKYIQAAELGAHIRVDAGDGSYMHSLVLVDKNKDGFTVYQGNFNSGIYFTYYTYEGFAEDFEDYKYFDYITYPNAKAYKVVDNGECGDNLTWTLDNAGTLTISGEGEMDYRPSFNSHGSEIKRIFFDGNATSISDSAFRDWSNLAEINIPDSITSVDSSAFLGTEYYNNPNNWENDVLYIDNCLIATNNQEIAKYEIKEGTTVIASGAFCTYKSELAEIIIPYGVRNICKKAFDSCSKLIKVELPDTVETIEYSAFGGCTNLQSINIPKKLKTIEPGAFGYTGSLIITADKNNPSFLAEDGVLFNKDKTEILVYAKDKICSDYEIPDSVVIISEEAFGHCKNLNSIKISENVTDIKESAFIDSSLKNITIPNSVVNIGVCAFQWCDELEYVIMGKGVKLIDDCAFTINGKLRNVYYAGTKDEWKKINILPYNFELADVHTNAIGIKSPNILSVYVQNIENSSQVNVSLSDTEYDSFMITAFYKNGILTDTQIVPIASGDLKKTVPITNTDIDTVRIFIWSNFGNMKPLTEVEKITL